MTPQLCTYVEAYPSGSSVAPGGTASFVVWVWATKASASNVTVTTSVATASYLGTQSFTICPSADGTSCKISSLATGKVYELLAGVPVADDAPLAATVNFTAKAAASGATAFTSSAAQTVVETTSAVLPTGSSSSIPPLIGLPPIPGTTVAPISPSQLFPSVGPNASGTTAPLALPAPRARKPLQVADVSSIVPIDSRLIGAQLLGLAVLAGAVTMAITRLSLRKTGAAAALAAPAGPADGGVPAPGQS